MIEDHIKHVMSVNNTEIVQIPVKIARCSVPACLDSGAAVNCISSALFTKINASGQYRLQRDEKALTGAGGGTLTILGYCYLPIELGRRTWNDRFYVVTSLSQPLIIGAASLIERQIDLINSTKSVRLKDNKGNRQCIPYINDTRPSPIPRVLVLNECIEIPPQCERIVRVDQPRSQMIMNSKDAILVESMPPCVKNAGLLLPEALPH